MSQGSVVKKWHGDSFIWHGETQKQFTDGPLFWYLSHLMSIKHGMECHSLLGIQCPSWQPPHFCKVVGLHFKEYFLVERFKLGAGLLSKITLHGAFKCIKLGPNKAELDYFCVIHLCVKDESLEMVHSDCTIPAVNHSCSLGRSKRFLCLRLSGSLSEASMVHIQQIYLVYNKTCTHNLSLFSCIHI